MSQHPAAITWPVRAMRSMLIQCSIVGSIGVVSAGFGFVEAIRKLGIERRVHTAGENKAILDPRPERTEDVDRLKALQLDVHEEFKTMMRDRRAGRLKEDNPDLFTGAFWSGRRALELGLIDGIGTMHQLLKERYGEEVVLKVVERSRRCGGGVSFRSETPRRMRR